MDDCFSARVRFRTRWTLPSGAPRQTLLSSRIECLALLRSARSVPSTPHSYPPYLCTPSCLLHSSHRHRRAFSDPHRSPCAHLDPLRIAGSTKKKPRRRLGGCTCTHTHTHTVNSNAMESGESRNITGRRTEGFEPQLGMRVLQPELRRHCHQRRRRRRTHPTSHSSPSLGLPTLLEQDCALGVGPWRGASETDRPHGQSPHPAAAATSR